MNITNSTQRHFALQLKKYGKNVIVDNKEYPVLFTRTRASNASEKVTVSYPQTYDWTKGTIFKYANDYYIIINRDAIESEVYYTSVAMKANTHWTFGGVTYHLVCGNLSGAQPDGGKMHQVGGNLTMYTCKSKFLDYDDVIYAFGGSYKCINRFDIDGLSYYYFDRTMDASATSYALSRDTTTSTIKVGQSASVHCILKYGDYYDMNTTYVYTSSDAAVATVDGFGVATGVSTGSATITCVATNEEGTTYSLSFDLAIADTDGVIVKVGNESDGSDNGRDSAHRIYAADRTKYENSTTAKRKLYVVCTDLDGNTIPLQSGSWTFTNGGTDYSDKVEILTNKSGTAYENWEDNCFGVWIPYDSKAEVTLPETLLATYKTTSGYSGSFELTKAFY